MFDWNDEELANILWGENGKSDDHIVPYQEESEDYRNKKEWSQETAAIKHAERQAMGAKIDFNGGKLESSSNFKACERSSASGFGMDSWSDLSSSNGTKTDAKPMGTEVSNRSAEIAKSNSTSSAVKTELDKDPEIFKNPQEGKDQGDFVDYSWANIGSFDDLDRIFSNDDPIFGNASLGTADELWSSSKDISNSPVKSFPLSEDPPSLEIEAMKNTYEHVEVESEFEQQDDKLLTLSHGKLNNPAYDLQSKHSTLDHVEYAGGKIKSFGKEQTNLGTKRNATASNSGPDAEHVVTPEKFANKYVQGYKQKNLLRGRRKLEEKSEGKLLKDLYGTWSITGSPYENQLAHPVLQSSPSSALSQQRQLPKSETLQYQQTNSFVTPAGYGNLTNPYPAMPVLTHMQSGEFKHQSLSSCYDVSPGKANPVNKSAATPAKPIMTPQEKIEKLRRRQQMQAILAIQKQQQQFSHPVSGDHSNPPKFQENQIHLVEGADLEDGDLSTLPSFDPNSPVEQDDSNTIYLAVDNNPVADAILYRLQDVIAQLDIRIRLCIRDSLLRLAQSAMRRHHAGDTSSTNKRDEPQVVTEADSNLSSRYPRIPDAETETNRVDRTIAHLLFHSPLDLPGKHPETPESPVSTQFQCERTVSCLPESSKSTQNLSHQEPNYPCSVPEPQFPDQFKSSPRMDTSENASNYGPVDSGAADVEASQ